MDNKAPHEEIRLQDLYSADDILSTMYEQGILDEDGVRLIMRKKTCNSCSVIMSTRSGNLLTGTGRHILRMRKPASVNRFAENPEKN